MDPIVYERYRAFLQEQTGVWLRQGQTALLRARLAERMKTLDIHEEAAYLRLIQSDQSGEELRCFINAITTNTTSFFRTPEHFRIFADHIRDWKRRGGSRYRVWCSASSSGEEPWSIAMVLAHEAPDWLNQDVKVLATDIDTNVLRTARNASYPAPTVAAVPKDMSVRFLVADRGSNEPSFSIRPDLRAMVSFARLNLTQLPYPMRGPFDVIFCRNVLIYFDHETRTEVITAMLELLHPRGILILGPSESALGLDHLVIRTTDSVYQRREPK